MQSFSVFTQLKLSNFSKQAKVHSEAEFFLTDAGVRLTKELWYEARTDPSILCPSKEELTPLWDTLYQSLDAETMRLDITGRSEVDAFDTNYKAQGLVMETLAQNKVADNQDIADAIEKVLCIVLGFYWSGIRLRPSSWKRRSVLYGSRGLKIAV
jgi:hypothetical protein